ncbi:MAG: hypothetical protein KAU62_12815 [Candidatus Heimdallarchaeota archaeon]|nr:hypothetical protein [Candidatus Heimdallarchaeota archaeon]MCG3256970.1 hypothetical protein [Candidatus Heimdallarchaeota archaeon]MCK4612033.1 hypothetical protein [Candidatus Heimdallarchaeota archaeon]
MTKKKPPSRIRMTERKPPPSKLKPDRLFDLVVIKMMTALAMSVALLFGGGTVFIYAVAGNIAVGSYDSSVGTIFGVHIALLMFYYSFALFKYIVSD